MALLSALFVFLHPSALPCPNPPSRLPPLSPGGTRELLASLPSLEAKSPAQGLFVSDVRRRKRRRRRRNGAMGERAWEVKARGEDVDAHGTSGAADLEAEIYEFMQRSAKPCDFPTRAELIAAGRADLAVAIAAQGGWLALGWDSEEETEKKGAVARVGSDSWQTGSGLLKEDGGVHQPRLECENSDADGGFLEGSFSGKSREVEEGAQDGGIEGILSRLEKERNWSYLTESKGRGGNGQISRGKEELDPGDRVLINHKTAVRPHMTSGVDTFPEFRKENMHNSANVHWESGISTNLNASRSLNCDTMAGSLSRASFPHADFEAIELSPNEERTLTENGTLSDASTDNKGYIFPRSVEGNGNGRIDSFSDRDQICSRLQNLQSDLTSALNSLRSRVNDIVSHKLTKNSISEVCMVSDEWEFQETDVLNARDELRSIHAKIAILEGKIAGEIIEAQKILEEKQRRLDAAQKALCLLRIACIVWPTTASEVLLAGSFDGWTSQRKMERSSAGSFSLHLTLYPGRYEIKFIVDGIWKVDPLRPIVNNNGHENNLLVIT